MAAQQRDACSSGDLISRVQAQASSIASYFSDVETLLRTIAQAMVGQYDNDLQGVQQYARVPPSADRDPYRAIEFASMLTSDPALVLNYSCVYDLVHPTVPWPPKTSISLAFARQHNCTYDTSYLLTDICAAKYPQCPNATKALASPIRVLDWARNASNPWCPIYCLNPARFNNSYLAFTEDLSRPMEIMGPQVSTYYYPQIDLLYWASTTSQNRAGITFYPTNWYDELSPRHRDMNAIVPQLFYAQRPMWETTRAAFEDPYPDGYGNGMMTTMHYPVYYHSEYIGDLMVDLRLTSLGTMTSAFSPNRDSFSFITSYPDLGILAANATVYDRFFCPSTTNCDTDGHYDFTNAITSSLYDSPHNVSTITGSLATKSPAFDTVLFDSRAFHMYSTPVPIPNTDWVLSTLVPVDQIDRAAIWSLTLSPRSIVVDRTSPTNVTIVAMLENIGLQPAPWRSHISETAVGSVAPTYGVLQSGQSTPLTVTITPEVAFRSGTSLVQVYASGHNDGGCFPSLVEAVAIEYEPLYIAFAIPAYLTGIVIASCVAVVAMLAGTALLIVRHRQSTRIKAFSPPLLLLSLAGAVLLSSASLTFAFLPASDLLCQCRWWMTALGFIVTFAPLFIKTYRINRIFNSLSTHVIAIPNALLYKGVSVLTGIVIVILMVETLDPTWKSVRAVVPVPSIASSLPGYTTTLQICTSNSYAVAAMIGFLALLTIWGAVTSWKVRHTPDAFNEAFTLSVSIVTVLVYAAIMIPVQILNDNNPLVLVVIRGLGVNVGILLSMGALFYPKLELIYHGRQNDKIQTATSGHGHKSGFSRATVVGAAGDSAGAQKIFPTFSD